MVSEYRWSLNTGSGFTKHKIAYLCLQALDERKKKLTEIEDRTAKVSDNASEFSDLAALLVKKYERK